MLILQRLIEQTGIAEMVIKIAADHPRLSYDLQKTIFTLMVSPFIKPVSKLCIYDNWIDRFYPQMIDGNLQLLQMYRCLDLLAAE